MPEQVMAASTEALLTNTVKTILFVLFVISGKGAFLLNVLADTFQSHAPTFPLVPAIVSGIMLNGLCAFFVALYGRVTVKGFRFYQPFNNSPTFQAMQGIGYTLLALASVMLLLYLEYLMPHDAVHRYGLISALGCVCLMANILLMVSLWFFESPRQRLRRLKNENLDAKDATSSCTAWWKNLSLPPNGEIAIVVLLCVSMLICSAIAECYSRLCRVMAIVDIVLLLCSISITHFVVGYRFTPGYHLFLPGDDNVKMCAIQGLGWLIGLVALYLDVVLCRAGVDAPSSWNILRGLTSVAGVGVLLLFVRLHQFPSPKPTEVWRLARNGSCGITAVCLVNLVFVCALALILSTDNYRFGEQLRQGLVACHTLAALFMFALPLCTHFVGRVALGNGYGVWVVRRCTLEFSILQCVGWVCYVFAIFFGVLHMTETRHFTFAVLQSLLAAFSQCLIHASLYVFGGVKVEGPLRGDGTPVPVSPVTGANGATVEGEVGDEEGAGISEQSHSLASRVLNGEMLTSILISSFGLVVRLIADIERSNGAFSVTFLYIPMDSLLYLTDAISLVAVPLAHISSRDRISIWQPFVGCGGYVAMQTLGWIGYAVNFVIVSASVLQEGRPCLAAPLSVGNSVLLQYTVEGVFSIVALVCIILSSLFETQAQLRERAEREKLRREIMKLRHLLSHTAISACELEQIESLLKTMLGSTWRDAATSGENMLEHEKLEKAQSVQKAIENIVIILCICSVILFMTSALLAKSQSVFALVFGVAGVVLTTVSCCSLHCFYGSSMHGHTGRYSVFMPFLGGNKFIALQGVGWSCYTAALLLVLSSCFEGHGSSTVFVWMCFFSIAAQCFISRSISHFDATQRPAPLLEQNSEVALAAITLIGSFTFALVCDSNVEGGVSGRASCLLPIIISSIAASCAVPLGFLSLKRHGEYRAISPFLSFEALSCDSDEDDEYLDGGTEMIPTVDWGASNGSSFAMSSVAPPGISEERGAATDPSEASFGHSDRHTFSSTVDTARRRSSLPKKVAPSPVHTLFFILALFATALWVIFVPITLFHVFYSYAYSGLAAFRVAFTFLHSLLAVLSIAVAVPLLAPRFHGERYRVFWRACGDAAITFVTYSIPTIVVSVVFFVFIMVDTMGASAFVFNMVFISCASTLSCVELIVTLMNACFLGCMLHYHLYTCLVLAVEPISIWRCVVDFMFAVFWLWYLHGYGKRPHVTGSMCSATAREYFRVYVAPAIVNYFSASLIVDGKGKADGSQSIVYHHSGDAGSGEIAYPCHSDPSKQYVYSFHPHGVFPGTALWLPLSPQWEKLIGRNSENTVTTHGADVIFAVPFMRDVMMSLGTMSVSRKGIESSLNQNNSPVIVTGGMAEMALQKGSDTEMHIVTHHSGFVRVAMHHKVPLVPVLCFAEHNVMLNVSLPRLQRWTSKKVGFPFPTMPYGRWYLPLPQARRLTVVVGKPIVPETGMCEAGNAEHVERYRLRYFNELQRLFFRYRVEAGYPNMALHLHYGSETRVVTEYNAG